MTPARPGPGSDALRGTLTYYRDLGVAELYLDERSKEHEEKEISANVNRVAGDVAEGSAAAAQVAPASS
ncbi:MAG TPA: hypothetical protein VHQ44_02320, partial [Thermoanaerobaculia bacterium]|nr:hypothetical protein [Thermoanaerobaculia bacterium]